MMLMEWTSFTTGMNSSLKFMDVAPCRSCMIRLCVPSMKV